MIQSSHAQLNSITSLVSFEIIYSIMDNIYITTFINLSKLRYKRDFLLRTASQEETLQQQPQIQI